MSVDTLKIEVDHIKRDVDIMKNTLSGNGQPGLIKTVDRAAGSLKRMEKVQWLIAAAIIIHFVNLILN